ncbi:acetyltransferase [Collinsella sp. AGMB00827]|uniref:Acetyltransferase n=1 Tax=Collinsella ureilytica TaxID=2869515 RepID=A0ABS7MK84_9ACTN|nr:acyltransferase family protein [Collinsella urealyticum]MBY4797728.1 acetyltransferase [Collinsella urealyticum]
MNSARQRRLRYIPSLDGIRALAVAAVVLYHLNPGAAPGGMIGVTVFFVLSGYLITRLLIREFVLTCDIDFKSFWKRRLRRLLPATVVVIVATAALCTICNHVMLTKMRTDILPSLLFFNNWWQVAHEVSYFNNIGNPSPLTHFWSLAIEMQFYLVWPVLLLISFRLRVTRRVLRRVTLALALASAVAMALLYSPGADPSRVYYGLDTRACSLLMGCWLALLPAQALSVRWIYQRLQKARVLALQHAEAAGGASAAFTPEAASMAAEETSNENNLPTAARVGDKLPRSKRADNGSARHSTRTSLDALGVIGLVGLVLMSIFTNGYDAFSYRGGTLLATMLTLAVIAACAWPGSRLARIFSNKALVWIGQRSYSIYLWHYPLLLLMNPASDVSQKPWWVLALQVVLVVAISALCYQFIETPFRQGVFDQMLTTIKGHREEIPALARRHAAVCLSVSALLLVSIGGLLFVPDTSALSAEGAALLQESGSAESEQKDKADDKDGKSTSSKDEKSDSKDKADEDIFPAGSYDVLLIGDSVSLRAVPAFQETFPHGQIDALINRQFSAGIEVFDSYVQESLAGKIAVFALGTNGPVDDAMIDELMSEVGNKRSVVFVTTRSPTSWEGSTNVALWNAAKRYANVRIVDWYGYSTDRSDLFDGDGTHLSEGGAQEYIQLIYNAIADVLPKHPEDAQQTEEAASTDAAAAQDTSGS